MNENLPMKENNGLFTKLKLFFRKLFYRFEKKSNDEFKEKNKIEENNIQKEIFPNSIVIEVDNSIQKEFQKNELFEKIINNPEVLKKLSNEQLEMFNKYANKVIEKNKEIIKTKKDEISKLKKVS